MLAIYWQQSRPFTAAGPLRQSTQPGSIIDKIAEFQHDHGLGDRVTLDEARTQLPGPFAQLEQDVVTTVIRYPIPLLQKLGSGTGAIEDCFIYTHGWSEGAGATRRADFDDRMLLVDDAGAHLVALAGLLRPLVQRDWLAFVAKRNAGDVDELRLQRFLFGRVTAR